MPDGAPSIAVTVERPTSSTPSSRAAIASGTVDMPSRSAPTARSQPASAQVS